MAFKYLSNTDPDVARIINAELVRQRNQIELISSENIASPAVMEAMGRSLKSGQVEKVSAVLEDWGLKEVIEA